MAITVRPIQESELKEAQRICGLAFGTFVGHPQPERFMEGLDYIGSRWRSSPDSAFVAVEGDRLVGSNVATNWGSFSFFGPLTVDPAFWDRKVGTLLMQPVMSCFDRWNSRLQGLFTFAQSSKHVGLYGKFGFWPRFLTRVVARPVSPEPVADGLLFSRLSDSLRQEALAASLEVTDSIFNGLDLRGEMQAIDRQRLGDTVLIEDSRSLSAFAVCHCGPQTEAGMGRCYIKFAAVRSGPRAETHLIRLLAAVEGLARERRLQQVVTGVNLGREKIARLMEELGFKTMIQGVAMHRPNDPGFCRRDAFVLDDWR